MALTLSSNFGSRNCYVKLSFLIKQYSPLSWPAESPSTEAIDGTWRLVFGTTTKQRFLQYVPVNEDFQIDLQQKTVALVSSIGPFRFDIKGQVFGWEPSRGMLDFQFKEVEISFVGNKVIRRMFTA